MPKKLGDSIGNIDKDEFINWFKTVIIPIILKDKKLDLSYQKLDDSHMPLLAECLEFLPEGFTIELNLRGNNKITDLRPLSPGLNKVHQLAIMDDIKKLPDFSQSSVVQLDMGPCESFDSYDKFLIAISGSPIMSLSITSLWVHRNNVLFAMAHKIVDKNIKTFKNTINSLCKKEASDLTKLDFAWYKKFAPFVNEIRELYPTKKYLPTIDNKFNECVVIKDFINNFIYETVIQYWYRIYKVSQNVDDANALILSFYLDNNTSNWDILKISFPMPFVGINAILPSNEDYVVVAKTLSKSRDTWCSYKTQDYGKFIRNFAKDEFINWFKTVIIPIILKDKKLDLSYQELDDSHIPLLAECLEFLPEGFTIELNLRRNNKITDLRPLSPGLNKVHQLAIMDDIKKLPDFSESSVVQLNMVYCKSFDSYYKFLIAISGSPIMSLSVHGNNVLFAMAHKIVDKNIKTFKNTINSLCKKEASDLTKLDFAWYKKFAPFANKILSLYPATEHLPDIDNKFNECAVINKAINDFICKTVIQYWLKEYKIQNVDDANALISEYGLNNDINNWDVLKISVPMSFVKLDAILPPNLTEDDGVNTVGDTITDQ